MSTSDTNSAGTGATGAIGGVGTGGVAWSNPSNITSFADNNYASVDLSNTNTTSETLIATNFGFSFPSSDNVTIDGIVCTFERKASAADVIRDSHIYLVYNNGLIGDNKVAAPAYWSTTEGAVSFGSPTDLWGISSMGNLLSVLQDSSFGVLTDAIWQSAYSGTETAYVDQVTITIYYTAVDFLGKLGSTDLIDIYYGSNQVSRVYYGSIRVV